MESENSKKVELIGINSQSDTEEVLKRLVASLTRQGFNVVGSPSEDEQSIKSSKSDPSAD